MARLIGQEQDYNDPNNFNGRIMGEKETRLKLLYRARVLGPDCEKQLKILFAKIDSLMRGCTNEQEALDIGKMGSVEVFKLLEFYGSLYYNNNLTIKDKE